MRTVTVEYQYFVERQDGALMGGWDFKSDAADDAKDNKDFYGPTKIVHISRIDKTKLAAWCSHNKIKIRS